MSGSNPESTDAGAFDPIEFLEGAVAIPSHEDVAEMRAYLVATLERHDVDVEVDEAGNVRAYKESPEPDAGPHVVLNTHVDTVSPHVAFERDRTATVAGESGVDVIRGRGACDAKGPLAALLAAFLRTDPRVGRLTLAITPDEETLSTGAHALVDPDAAGLDREPLDGDVYVVGEPTNLDVCTAAKGRFEGTVHLTGENAHAAEFEGVNAVAAAEGALKAIRRFDDGAEPHEQLGPPKLTPTVIEGGEATNQVPADCAITVDRRSVPPETAEGFADALETEVGGAVPDDVGADFRLASRDTPFLEAFATDADHELVRTLVAAATDAAETDAVGGAALGGDAAGDDVDVEGGDVRPFSAATEASYFSPSPTVVFGPGELADDEGAVAHAEREYVRVAQVERAADAVTATLDALLS